MGKLMCDDSWHPKFAPELEDNPVNRELLREILEADKYRGCGMVRRQDSRFVLHKPSRAARCLAPVNCEPGGHLDRGLKAAPARTLGSAAGNKNDVLRL